MRCVGSSSIPLLLVLLTTVTGACTTVPEDTPEAIGDRVTFADELIRSERIDEADAVLDTIDRDDLSLDGKALFDLARARVLAAQGRLRTAFCSVLDQYPENFRFRPELEIAAALHMKICEALVERDGSLWWVADCDLEFFDGDREFAETRLIQFLERYPGHFRGANALRLLGRLHEDELEWQLARFRYEELLQEYPSSEWVPLAQFRLAIASFNQIEGVCYDEGQMNIARRELQTYLNLQPEQPQAVEQATLALDQVERWLSARWLRNADYYRTIDNEFGERSHLDRILREFPDSAEAPEARRRLGLTASVATGTGAGGGDETR